MDFEEKTLKPACGDTLISSGRIFQLSYGRYEAIRKGCLFGLNARFSRSKFLKKEGLSIEKIALNARKTLIKKLKKVMRGPDALLVCSIMFGREKKESSSLYDTLSIAGLSHIVAVSGLHIACFSFTVLFFLSRAGVGRKTRYLLACLSGGMVLALSGFRPSACRAFIMCSTYFLGKSINRRYDPIIGLSFAGILMSGFNPSILTDTGFQLSFAATFGISILARDELTDNEKTLRENLRKLLTVTTAAQIAVIPILTMHGESVSLFGVIANIVVVPLVGPTLVSGWLAVLLSFINPGLGRFLGFIPSFFSKLVCLTACLVAKIPCAYLSGITSSAALIIYVVGLILLVRSLLDKRKLFAPFAVIMAAIAVLLFPGFIKGTSVGRGRVVFLDVGQGDAILIEDGSGISVLIDAGPDERDTLKKIQKLGVTNLEALIISHPHSDHITGMERIIRNIPVGLIVKPGVKNNHSFLYDKAMKAAREKNIPAINGAKGMVLRLSKAFSVEVLYPFEKEISEVENLNNSSLVAMAKLGEQRILLLGDLEKEAQIFLLDDHADLSCSVLKVPHQGSIDAFNPQFLRACDPEVAVICVERNNKYGHPSTKFITFLRKEGIKVYRTDVHGDVTVSFEGGRITTATKN